MEHYGALIQSVPVSHGSSEGWMFIILSRLCCFIVCLCFLSHHLAVLGGMSRLNWHEEKRFDSLAVAFVVFIENYETL